MTFWRKKQPPPRDETEDWKKLLLMSQTSCLDLAYCLQTALNDPDAVTIETREEIQALIVELENGIAQFQEFVL